jgi:hypothetical protein
MSVSCGNAALYIPRRYPLFSFQAVCALSVLYGISMWSVPAAFVVGGVAGIVAVEVR